MSQITFILTKPISEFLYPVYEGFDILKAAASIRMEMFHHKIKVISQNISVICTNPESSETRAYPRNME